MHPRVALFRRLPWALTVGVTMFLFACSDTPDIEPLKRFGSVSIGASATAAWTPEPFGMFYRTADQPPRDSCTVEIDNGKCRVWSCTEAAYAGESSMKTIAAGRVEVNSASGSIELTRGEDGFYRLTPTPEQFWPDRGNLTLRVGGSEDFPQLSTSAPAPMPLVVTEPTLTGAPWAIDKSVDLALKWSGPALGTVVVTISPETTNSLGNEPLTNPGVDCEFPAAAGEAQVPSAFLKMLPTPATLIQYYLDVFTYTASSVQSGDAWVDFRVSWVGLSTAVTAP